MPSLEKVFGKPAADDEEMEMDEDAISAAAEAAWADYDEAPSAETFARAVRAVK